MTRTLLAAAGAGFLIVTATAAYAEDAPVPVPTSLEDAAATPPAATSTSYSTLVNADGSITVIKTTIESATYETQSDIPVAVQQHMGGW